MSEKLYWHPIYTDYACTIDGRVWSNKKHNGITGRWIRYGTDGGNYLTIYVCMFGQDKTIRHHKFVYECVTGKLLTLSTKSGDGLTIDHIDGNKHNNAFANLQVITSRKNRQKHSCKCYCFEKDRNKWKVYYWDTDKTINDNRYLTEQEAITRVEELRKEGKVW